MVGIAWARRWIGRTRHVQTWQDAVTIIRRQRDIAARNALVMSKVRRPGTPVDAWTARAMACSFLLRELERATAAHAHGARS